MNRSSISLLAALAVILAISALGALAGRDDASVAPEPPAREEAGDAPSFDDFQGFCAIDPAPAPSCEAQ